MESEKTSLMHGRERIPKKSLKRLTQGKSIFYLSANTPRRQGPRNPPLYQPFLYLTVKGNDPTESGLCHFDILRENNLQLLVRYGLREIPLQL